MHQLINLQFTMFFMIAAGMILKKIGIIGPEGQKNITDLVIYLVLPCNIIKSFLFEFTFDILITFTGVLIISILIQVGCSILGKVLYQRMEVPQKKVLQYATICSNAGFLGNPIAEGYSVNWPDTHIHLPHPTENCHVVCRNIGVYRSTG
jgi:predicted permease